MEVKYRQREQNGGKCQKVTQLAEKLVVRAIILLFSLKWDSPLT